MAAILDQTADAGRLYALFTGGEPWLRPGFSDIYRYARQRGMLVSLFANGTLLTPERAGFLAEWRPGSIEIGLYGRKEETYERVTRLYARCMRGIELCVDRGLPLSLKAAALSLNRYELLVNGKYAVVGQTKIYDLGRAPVAGATVQAQWTFPDGSLLEQEAVTDLLGRAKFRLKSSLPGTYQMCITDVTKPGWIYDPARNMETCDTATTPSR